MALTKVVTEDKIEIVGEFKSVQVRTKTAVMEDGIELSSGFHRHVVSAGDDYSAESAEVQAICAAVHSDAVVAALAAHLEASALGEQRLSLYENINKKKKRIKAGSNETMKKAGMKGRPTANDFKQAAKTAKKRKVK